MWTPTAHMMTSVAFWGIVVTSAVGRGDSQEHASINATANFAMNGTNSSETQPVAEPVVWGLALYCMMYPGDCRDGVRKVHDFVFPGAPVQSTARPSTSDAARTARPTTSGGSLWTFGVSMLAVLWTMANF